jgi:hypothetical protein
MDEQLREAASKEGLSKAEYIRAALGARIARQASGICPKP